MSLIRNNVTSTIFATPPVRTTGYLSFRRIVNRIPKPIFQSCFLYFPRLYLPVHSPGHSRFQFNVTAFRLRKVCIKNIGTPTVYLRINNQQGASSIQNFILSRDSTCFGHLLCPSSGVISCTRGNWYVSSRLCGRFLGGSGCSNLTLLITPDDRHRRCPKHVESRDKMKFWILEASCWLFIRRLSRCTVT